MNQDILQVMKNKLIEARTIEEAKLKQFAESIANINTKEVFGDIELPMDLSLKSLCPEAYKDDPNPEVYQEQYEKMVELFNVLNAKIISYNQEAIEALNEYKMMN